MFFKKLIENKSVGYFMAAGIALLSLITAVFFIATQNGNMGNYAAGVGPETIGVFLLAGFVVEVVALLLPQYRFIHIAALVMYGLAFYKETILIPDFIAGKINNVEYNGGSFGLNMTYFALLFIIVVASVVVAFLGFYKDEKQAQKEMSVDFKNKPQIIKVGTGALVALVAVVVACVISKGIVDSSSANTDPLITSAVRKAAKKEKYKFKPSSVLIKEPEKEEDPNTHELVYPYDYNEIKNYPTNGDKPYEGAQLVYRFEGAYAEGYQGDYSQTYAYLYLWDNGTFTGEAGTTNQGKIRGYWFNSSLAEGHNSSGKDIKDCLQMVSNVNRYESIICQKASGFYQWQAYIYLRMSWNGDRSIIVNGYEYYPNCAVVINNNGAETNAVMNEDFDLSFWQADRVITNLTHTSVQIPTEVDWYIDGGNDYVLDGNTVSYPFTKKDLKEGDSTIGVIYETSEGTISIEYVDGDKNRGIAQVTANFKNPGTQKVVARWTKIVEKTDPDTNQKYKEFAYDYAASIDVNVEEAASEE